MTKSLNKYIILLGSDNVKRIIYRILAYIIDILLVTLLTFGLTYLPCFKNTNQKVGAYYVSLSTNEVMYNNLINILDDYYEDAKISESEMAEINDKYANYAKCFKDIKVEEEVTNKMKSDIETNIKKTYVDTKNNVSYEINKCNVSQSIIGIVLYILYFGVFQYFMKGQTLGKKLFKLKVKKCDDSKFSLLSYIIRSILVCEILITGLDLIFLLTMNKSMYITSNYWILQVKYIYEILFIVVMIIRDDNRSVHDLLLNTCVVRMDKEGNEIKEQLFEEKNEKNINKTN